MKSSAGKAFRHAISEENPLQILGCINAYNAIMAEKNGAKSLYLSGAGVANASYGIPDLGLTSLDDILIDAERISRASECPLLVDIDTGFGDHKSIAKCIKALEGAGVAAVHIEDQIDQKRCGHRPGKKIVSSEAMQDRIKAAVDARTDANFFIMARTDAFAQEGLDRAVERSQAYSSCGADGIFAEAITEESHYRAFSEGLNIPILANMTEFGLTDLYSSEELSQWGVAMVLYPLSAFRAMNKASEQVYRSIMKNGHQRDQVEKMQTRAELYEYLSYYESENKIDKQI